MACKLCAFYGKKEEDETLLLCLVDGQVYDKWHNCHMSTIDEKITEANKCKLAQPFDKNQDMVRAALKIMKDYGLTANNAFEAVKIIHGRYY